MSLRFIEHEDVIFAGAPLTSVLTQIRFPPVLSLLTGDGVVGFQTALRDAYPVLQREDGAEIQVDPKGLSLSQSAPIWRLRDEADQWKVGLAVDFVSLETPSYKDFGDFKSRLSRILAVLDRTVHPAHSIRVGLRKINDITHPDVHTPSDWTKLLRPELVGVIGSSGLPGTLESAFTDVRLLDDDNVFSIKHGIKNDEERGLTYRLDLDYFTQTELPIAPEGELVTRLEDFSKGISSFFHWCLTSEMYKWLRPKPRGVVGDGD